jgi:hypothetical protein
MTGLLGLWPSCGFFCLTAASAYNENPVALHLCAMNMLYEAIKEKGAMVIVPSSVVERWAQRNLGHCIPRRSKTLTNPTE